MPVPEINDNPLLSQLLGSLSLAPASSCSSTQVEKLSLLTGPQS